MRLVVVAVAIVAGCTPAAFDGLTSDGKKSALGGADAGDAGVVSVDPALAGRDPRPIAPFSTSWVNTARPHLKWALQDGTTGATIELSHTRDFATIDLTKTATGSDFVLDEDLSLGVWFWRLQARTATTTGTTHSAPWEVLVRGPAKNGKATEAPRGGFNDLNGDGVLDFTYGMTVMEQMSADPADIQAETFIASAFGIAQGTSGTTTPIAFNLFNVEGSFWDTIPTEQATIASGFDVNGDGYGDLVWADIAPPDAFDPEADGVVWIDYGGPGGVGSTTLEPTASTQLFLTRPVIDVGDFNGDGYGDISAVFPDVALTYTGNSAGSTALIMPFDTANAQQIATPTAVTLAMTTGDFDGDGITDVAYTPYDALEPLRVATGSATRFNHSPNLTVGSDLTLPTRAIAFTSGDFDGDGADEVAFSTTVNGKAAVCVFSTAVVTLNAHGCWITDAPTAGFGTTLGTGDFDGDGTDDILVGSADGVTLLTHNGLGYSDGTSWIATKVDGAYSANFSVFNPGRPGKAQWAVYGSDGHTFYIVTGAGTDAVQSFDHAKLKDSPQQTQFVRFVKTIR